jgi:hypothetical protein
MNQITNSYGVNFGGEVYDKTKYKEESREIVVPYFLVN